MIMVAGRAFLGVIAALTSAKFQLGDIDTPWQL
jgi:hypothetical protein